jgi:hypothetical protein
MTTALMFIDNERGIYTRFQIPGKVVKPMTSSKISKAGLALISSSTERERTIFVDGESVIAEDINIDVKFVLSTFYLWKDGYTALRKVMLNDRVSRAIVLTGDMKVPVIICKINGEYIEVSGARVDHAIEDLSETYSDLIISSLTSLALRLNSYGIFATKKDSFFEDVRRNVKNSTIHEWQGFVEPRDVYPSIRVESWMYPVVITDLHVVTSILPIDKSMELMSSILSHNTMCRDTWKKYGLQMCGGKLREFANILAILNKAIEDLCKGL